jgi:hypothetical protein
MNEIRSLGSYRTVLLAASTLIQLKIVSRQTMYDLQTRMIDSFSPTEVS